MKLGKHVGAVIRRLREKSGFSTDHLAKCSGTYPEEWTLLEEHGDLYHLDTLCDIAHTLSLAPSELLALAEKDHEHETPSGSMR